MVSPSHGRHSQNFTGLQARGGKGRKLVILGDLGLRQKRSICIPFFSTEYVQATPPPSGDSYIFKLPVRLSTAM